MQTKAARVLSGGGTSAAESCLQQEWPEALRLACVVLDHSCAFWASQIGQQGRIVGSMRPWFYVQVLSVSLTMR